MKTVQTSDNKQLKVVSLIIPLLITCLVPALIHSTLAPYQIAGSGILVLVIILSIISGDFKALPDKDISILWVASLLYNAYLLTHLL